MLLLLIFSYCFIAMCATIAVYSTYSEQVAPTSMGLPEFIGCLVAGALWPALVIVKLFGILNRL
jgi:hypothetical protein